MAILMTLSFITGCGTKKIFHSMPKNTGTSIKGKCKKFIFQSPMETIASGGVFFVHDGNNSYEFSIKPKFGGGSNIHFGTMYNRKVTKQCAKIVDGINKKDFMLITREILSDLRIGIFAINSDSPPWAQIIDIDNNEIVSEIVPDDSIPDKLHVRYGSRNIDVSSIWVESQCVNIQTPDGPELHQYPQSRIITFSENGEKIAQIFQGRNVTKTMGIEHYYRNLDEIYIAGSVDDTYAGFLIVAYISVYYLN